MSISVIRWLVLVLGFVAALSLITMVTVTCLDVILRAFGRPLVGALDIVKIAGALAIATGLPYTTAVKGHVAIEYFFLKLPRRWRILVTTICRLLIMALFGVLSWSSARYGADLKRYGQVTATLDVPLFWVSYVIAASCGVVVLVMLCSLLRPDKEMIRR
ncbi:MAG: TRAP transporter small permease [Planctomycetes bacterium]|nr:TRAP transporter small permease [Planctomycetota bacterium]